MAYYFDQEALTLIIALGQERRRRVVLGFHKNKLHPFCFSQQPGSKSDACGSSGHCSARYCRSPAQDTSARFSSNRSLAGGSPKQIERHLANKLSHFGHLSTCRMVITTSRGNLPLLWDVGQSIYV